MSDRSSLPAPLPAPTDRRPARAAAARRRRRHRGPAGRRRDASRYANLDSAASAPALERGRRRVTEVLPLYASVHRGAGYLSQVSTALLRVRPRHRRRASSAPGADDVVRLHPQHHRLAEPAGRLRARGDAVLVLDCEHHANLLPWQRRGPVDRAADASPPSPRPSGAGRRAGPHARTPWSRSPAPPTSPARRCRWTEVVAAGPRRRRPGARRRRPARPAPALLARRDRASTTSPSPATRSTPRSAPAPWSAAATGSTPARRTSPAEARCTRSRVDGDDLGARRRTGTRAARRTCSAPSRSPRPATRSRAARPARWRRTSARCGSGWSPGWRALAGRRAAADLVRLGGADRGRHLHRRRRRPGSGRRLPLRRARHRRARRPVLRAPAAGPARDPGGRAARQRRRRQHARRTSTGWSAAITAFLARRPAVRYELVSGRWQPVDDPRPLAGLGGADPAASPAAPAAARPAA